MMSSCYCFVRTNISQTPFWASDHGQMYARVLQDELKFPDDRVMDQDTKSLIRGVSPTDRDY